MTSIASVIDDDIKKMLADEWEDKVEAEGEGETEVADDLQVEVIEDYKHVIGKHKAKKIFPGIGKFAASIEVEVFSKEYWPEWARPYIPDVDNTYIFPKEQTEAIVGFITRPSKRAAFMSGPKGTGKSSLPEQIAARLNIPLFRVNLSRDSTSDSLMGGIKTVINPGGHMELGWAPGPVELAAICGDGAWCLIDEFSFTPAGCNVSLQRVLERFGKLYLETKPNEHERLVSPGPNFKIFATDNTKLQGDLSGGYTGTHVQNEATIDRFQVTIDVPYMGSDHEIKLVMRKVPEADKPFIEKAVQVAALIRTCYNKGELSLTMSPRGLIEWADDYVFWGKTKGSMKRGYDESFANKLGPEDAAKAKEFFRKTFG